MKRVAAALLAGVLFGVGLALARMTDPRVVLGFLDLFGRFDPTLAFVLGGAVGTTMLVFRLILRRERPLLADTFQLPTSRAIDRPLLLGAGLFGIGWGLAGYCPGPALVGAAGGINTALMFLPALIAGILLHPALARRSGPRPRRSTP
jgi:uncharacterized membrane protein YedE/YeeE